MLDHKVLELLNFQVNREFYSAFLYRDMANYFAYHGLEGISHWFNIQATEEKEHAILLMQYITDCGERVKLATVEAPPYEYDNHVAVFRLVLEHEQLVTSYIHKIVEAANAAGDITTAGFLDWFVQEQIEEEKTARLNLRRLELVGDSGAGLFAFDGQLQARQHLPNPLVRGGLVN